MEMIYKEHLTRQADIIDVKAIEQLNVVVIGCGAIGSFATLALAKMGVERIKAYDPDTVDIVNISNQFYRFKDIGTKKAIALKDIVHDFTGVNIEAYPVAVTPDGKVYADIVVMAVDSMKVRAELFKIVHAKYLIDTRMAAEKYTQYVVDMRSMSSKESYEKTLYTDSEAVQEVCTAKSTIYTALVSGSMVCKAVKNIVAKEPHPKTILMDLKQSSNNMLMFTKEK